MIDPGAPLTNRTVLRFWLPLEATWLMMAAEGPFLAALIARLADAKLNLAAYGVVTSLAWIVESPIINILSATNALARDKVAFHKMRRFAMTMILAVTAVMLLLLTPPVFGFVTGRLIGLPPDVAKLAFPAMAFMALWPGAIGFRRFYQGILIRQGKPRAVAVGTVVRLGTMAIAGLVLALAAGLPGASVGAGALGAGVVAEAAASWFMARRSVHRILKEPDEDCPFGRDLTQGRIGRFYLPLGLMSFLALAIHPMTTFFLGRSRQPIESLAVMPVVLAMVFLFRTPGIAVQEVVIALLGERGAHRAILRGFSGTAGALASAAMTAVIFSPLAKIWLCDLSGLTPELAGFALAPARIMVLIPALEAMISFQRGVLVKTHWTWPVMTSVVVQVAIVAAALTATVIALRMVGATAAGLSVLAGYAAATLVLTLGGRKAGILA